MTQASQEPAPFARDPARPRILISRMSAIGDTILTTPVACRLRERFPNAFLAWVVEEKSSQFIRGHATLDEVVVVPRGWFGSPSKVLSLAQRLRSMRFDAAVDCQSISKSALACWLSGARLRVGCQGKYGNELSPWLNNHLIEPQQPHLTDRTLELLAGLGLTAESRQPVAWNLPRSIEAEANMVAWLTKQAPDLTTDHGFAVINPGATWDSKLWENDRFAAVAAGLGRARGLRTLVVWGGERERGWAEAIVAGSEGWATPAPKTSLQELAALLREARLVISPDTGPMHLAVAVGTPTVGLFGATHPDDCGPYGTPHAAVLKQHQAGGRRERRLADNTAMRAISVEETLRTCEAVLDRTSERFPNAPQAMAS